MNDGRSHLVVANACPSRTTTDQLMFLFTEEEDVVVEENNDGDNVKFKGIRTESANSSGNNHNRNNSSNDSGSKHLHAARRWKLQAQRRVRCVSLSTGCC